MRQLASMFLAAAVLTSSACTRSDSSSAPGVGGDDSGPGSAGVPGAGSEEDTSPIALTDARLDKYLAFRKEFNRAYAGWVKDAGNVAKAVDSRSTSLTKAFTAAAGVSRLGEKYEKEFNALRARHGFTEREDDRLMSAISEVVGAKMLDNPLMGDGLKVYREMQAKGGEEKKAADEILKSFEDQEKQGIAEARKRYGDACVDVLARRAKELSQFQLDSMKEMAGQLEAEKQ